MGVVLVAGPGLGERDGGGSACWLPPAFDGQAANISSVGSKNSRT